MKRVVVYSDSSARPRDESRTRTEPGPRPEVPVAPAKRQSFVRRHRKALAGIAALAIVAAAAFWLAPRGLDASQVDAAVQRAIDAQPAKPTAADAYAKVLPSVVHVRGFMSDPDEAIEGGQNSTGASEAATGEGSVGTGVVIVETGIILTNLHVVNGSKRIKVTFFDGTEADADIIGVRAEHDLAVLQARRLPDDLQPATVRSTSGLRPGDEVVAIGFPFGIGPSATSGVVSGLKREYESQGKRMLSNLIQFDAAVNPGNSGGPLVTLDGEVVGIVTGLLNPTEQRVFVGLGFAVPIENAASALGLNPF
ncbi:MAG: S1C family serine protease [Clostridia bacterium]